MASRHGKIKANGVELYYEQAGQGPHLVLIEGLGVATWIWEKQASANSVSLSSRYFFGYDLQIISNTFTG